MTLILTKDMELDKHHTDLKEQVSGLRADIEDEKSLHRDWTLCRAENDKWKDDLPGARMKGQRADRRPKGVHSIDDPPAATLNPDDTLDSNLHYWVLNLNLKAGPSELDKSTITDEVISADPMSSDSRDKYGNGGQKSSFFPVHNINLNEFKVGVVPQNEIAD
ncbi:hypothetical protein B0H19DRAFT_1273785 [Mycena capillaripes]|nr:hypothetical protein B0H19DRAFT_1273785 [Mycena capillaripes]